MKVKPCYRTMMGAQACIICGVKEKYMHMPIGRVGYFCGQCCPPCVGFRSAMAYSRAVIGNRSAGSRSSAD